MLKCKGSAKGGGGSKSRKGGGGSTTVKKERKLQTQKEHLVLLRSCLWDDAGKDKNPVAPFAPFLQYKRNGLDLTLDFFSGGKLPRELRGWAFSLVKENIEQAYDASGYGWDDADKESELFDKAARLVIVREAGGDKKPVGLVHFRFTLQGEFLQQMDGFPAILVYDLHLESAVRGKGLGKHIMQLLELVARKNKLSFLMTFVPDARACEKAKSFFLSTLKGFAVDNMYTEDGEGIVVLQKCLDRSILLARQQKAAESKKLQDSILETLKQIEIAKAKQAAGGKENSPASK